jgi:hypothetical protein
MAIPASGKSNASCPKLSCMRPALRPVSPARTRCWGITPPCPFCRTCHNRAAVAFRSRQRRAADTCMARGSGIGNVDARTRAPPQPLCGTHARRPLLSGPEGRPEQSERASGAVGGCSRLLRASALWPRRTHRATPRQPELACCCSKVPILSRSRCSGAGWSPVGSWRGQPCEAHLVRVRVRVGVRASEQLERARVRGAPGVSKRRLRICNFSRG